jgi:MFS family permease
MECWVRADDWAPVTDRLLASTPIAGFSRGTVLASLFILSGFAQTIILTVLPVEAFRLLGDARDVSVVYFAAGSVGFLARLAIPSLGRLLDRHRVLMVGAAASCLSGVLLATETLGGLAVGLFINMFAFACFEIVLNLYVLDQIARNELGRFEAKRIFFASAPWTLGPWLGIYLQVHLASWLPFALSGATSIALIAVVRRCNLPAGRAVRPEQRKSLNPLRYLPRFFAQKRLRLAWILAVGRSAWWGMFQVYAPIYAVQCGLGAEIGGAIVSIGIGTMWSVPLWGWLGRRYGLRSLLVAGYASTGVVSVATALAMGVPWLGAAMLILAAITCEIIDGAGNTLYLRAVHAHERSEMTAVFASYRDVAQLAPPAVFAVLLSTFELPAIFIAGGLMMFGLAGLARYIPRRI